MVFHYVSDALDVYFCVEDLFLCRSILDGIQYFKMMFESFLVLSSPRTECPLQENLQELHIHKMIYKSAKYCQTKQSY